jgi:hypothetical protein
MPEGPTCPAAAKMAAAQHHALSSLSPSFNSEARSRRPQFSRLRQHLHPLCLGLLHQQCRKGGRLSIVISQKNGTDLAIPLSPITDDVQVLRQHLYK